MRTRSQHKRNRKAFSLLELVAVVTLIGIVAAVTMVRLNSVDQQTARDNVDSQNISLIQTAVERYRFDIGSLPTNTGVLVSNNYLASTPESPTDGGSYTINQTTGVVSLTTGS